MAPARILYLDVEGGRGGSSRSLFLLARYVDTARFQPTVWHRRNGDYGERLEAVGLRHSHEPNILSIIPRHKNNWKLWLAAMPRLSRLPALARRILEFSPDILHLNYEGLVPLHAVLSRLGQPPATVLHFRTMSPANAVYRAYARYINHAIRYAIYITENEREAAAAAGVDVERLPSQVLHNPVAPVADPQGRPIPRPGETLRIAFLGSLEENRGPDRLIDLAECLRARNIAACINVYGSSPVYKRWLVLPRRTLERLRAEVHRRELDEWITYHGRTEEPSRVLSESHLLIRPSREDNPWGRDVIEALSHGVPVLAHGQYSKFVRSGETGFLFPRWVPDHYARKIDEIAERPEQLGNLFANAVSLARQLFDPGAYAERVMGIYDEILARKTPADPV